MIVNPKFFFLGNTKLLREEFDYTSFEDSTVTNK